MRKIAIIDTTGFIGRRFLLADGDSEPRRVISNTVELAEGVSRSWVTVTRTGNFYDPRYGDFAITTQMLSQMVRNFDARVYGQDIFLDIDHKPGNGAAAKILALKVDKGRLRAHVEWTEFGIEHVRGKGFRYLSAEFDENWRDNEQRNAHGCTLLGAALTIRPVIKHLDPVTLSVAGDPDFSGPVFVHPGLVRHLTESLETITMNRWQKFLAELQKRGIKLSDARLAQLKAAFETGAKALAEDADDADFINSWCDACKALSEAAEGTTVQLSVTNPTQAADAATIATEVNRVLAERDQAAAQAVADTATRREQFTTALAAATGLSEPTRTQLAQAADLIDGSWPEARVTALATQQIAIGNQIEASRRLASLGFHAPAGTVRIASGGDNNDVRQLSEEIRVALGRTPNARTERLVLAEESSLPPFVQDVLRLYDSLNANGQRRELAQRELANGEVTTGDMSLPPSFQREVLKEALSDLNILNLVDAAVDPSTSATHTIPYERRDLSDMTKGGEIYEGQPIEYAGIEQDNDFAYIEPLKIAIKVSNEASHFSAANQAIDWSAYARAVASASRVVRELIHRRLANRWLRSSDRFGTIAFTSASAAAGTVTGNYKLASPNWPIVRPRQIRDLKGTAIGAVQNPLVVNVGGSPIQPYAPGLPNGNYYLNNRELYELGVVTVVNQAGVPVGSLTVTVSGSRVTNVLLFDRDAPVDVRDERHLNKLLQAIGNRKARLAQDRFVTPDFMFMAETLADTISNAEQFEASAARADASITETGDLGRIKGLPSWRTNAPNLDMGEGRILISQRGLLRYRVSKTFALGAPFEVTDPATGRPVGKRQAYGEEFSSAHVPEELDGYSTSLSVYSATARAAL